MVWIRPPAITIEIILIEDPLAAGLRSAHRRIRGRSEPPSQIPVNSERLLRVSSILPMTTGVYGLARGWKFHFFGIYRFQVSAHNNWAPPLIMPLLNYIATIGLNVNWSLGVTAIGFKAVGPCFHFLQAGPRSLRTNFFASNAKLTSQPTILTSFKINFL